MALFPLKAAQALAQDDEARSLDPPHRAMPGLFRAARRAGHVLRLFRGAKALMVDVEIATREEVVERLEDLAAARRDAEGWRARALLCEARIAELEGELAASSLVAMDLRARLVCLHGKLATTAATARYRRFSSALVSRAPGA